MKSQGFINQVHGINPLGMMNVVAKPIFAESFTVNVIHTTLMEKFEKYCLI